MRNAILTSDAAALRFAAHRLVGSSGVVGATQLAHLCTEMEMLGQVGALAFASVHLTSVEQELSRVVRALEQGYSI